MTQTTKKHPKINVPELPNFDLAEMLNTDEDIAAYLSIIRKDDNMSELTHALGVVARSASPVLPCIRE